MLPTLGPPRNPHWTTDDIGVLLHRTLAEWQPLDFATPLEEAMPYYYVNMVQAVIGAFAGAFFLYVAIGSRWYRSNPANLLTLLLWYLLSVAAVPWPTVLTPRGRSFNSFCYAVLIFVTKAAFVARREWAFAHCIFDGSTHTFMLTSNLFLMLFTSLERFMAIILLVKVKLNLVWFAGAIGWSMSALSTALHWIAGPTPVISNSGLYCAPGFGRAGYMFIVTVIDQCLILLNVVVIIAVYAGIIVQLRTNFRRAKSNRSKQLGVGLVSTDHGGGSGGGGAGSRPPAPTGIRKSSTVVSHLASFRDLFRSTISRSVVGLSTSEVASDSESASGSGAAHSGSGAGTPAAMPHASSAGDASPRPNRRVGDVPPPAAQQAELLSLPGGPGPESAPASAATSRAQLPNGSASALVLGPRLAVSKKPARRKDELRLLRAEALLLRRGVLVFAAFSLTWVFFVVHLFHALDSNTRVPSWLDQAMVFCICAGTTIDPLVILYMDRNFQREAAKVLKRVAPWLPMSTGAGTGALVGVLSGAMFLHVAIASRWYKSNPANLLSSMLCFNSFCYAILLFVTKTAFIARRDWAFVHCLFDGSTHTFMLTSNLFLMLFTSLERFVAIILLVKVKLCFVWIAGAIGWSMSALSTALHWIAGPTPIISNSGLYCAPGFGNVGYMFYVSIVDQVLILLNVVVIIAVYAGIVLQLRINFLRAKAHRSKQLGAGLVSTEHSGGGSTGGPMPTGMRKSSTIASQLSNFHDLFRSTVSQSLGRTSTIEVTSNSESASGSGSGAAEFLSLARTTGDVGTLGYNLAPVSTATSRVQLAGSVSASLSVAVLNSSTKPAIATGSRKTPRRKDELRLLRAKALLLRRGAAVFAAFLLTWVFFVVHLFHALESGMRVLSWLDQAFVVCINASTTIDPLVILYMDRNFQREAAKVLSRIAPKKRAGHTAMSIKEIVKNVPEIPPPPADSDEDADDDAAGSDGNAAVTPTNPLPPVTIAKPSKRKASGSKASSGKASGGKATFCSASTNFLLDHFCNLADDGVLGDSNTLKAQHRVSIAQALSDEFNMQFTAEQVKNRVTYLRTCFRAVKRLLSYSGNGCTWNEGECTVDVPEEFWNDLSAELKEELTAGCKPFPYYKKANMLWGSSTATGKYSHLEQDGKESGDVEGVDGQDDAAPASKRSRTSDSSSRRLSDSEFLMGIKEVFQSVATADSKPVLTAALEWVQDAYNDNEEYQIDVATRLTEDQALRVMAVSESKRKRVLEFFIQ
ncbi:hypothetical protein H9P43_004523 [Blastocladiella emersonii ATCC 22665]|nr:hypothetical protein H9P43_004523 [Blastocladiella emersonii ATCC 22665]